MFLRLVLMLLFQHCLYVERNAAPRRHALLSTGLSFSGEPASAKKESLVSCSQFKRFLRFSINNKSIGEIITDFRLRVVNCDNFGDGDTIVDLILSARHQFVVTICKGKDAHRHSP